MDMIVSIWHLSSTSCCYYFAHIQFTTPFRSASRECHSRCPCVRLINVHCQMEEWKFATCTRIDAWTPETLDLTKASIPCEVSSSLHQFAEFIKSFDEREKKTASEHIQFVHLHQRKPFKVDQHLWPSVESALVISSSSQNYWHYAHDFPSDGVEMPARKLETKITAENMVRTEIEQMLKCKLFPFFVRFSCEKAWNLIQMKLVITEYTAKRAFTNEFIWASFRVFNKCHSFLLNSTTICTRHTDCADRMHIRCAWACQSISIHKNKTKNKMCWFFSSSLLCRWTNECIWSWSQRLC